MVTSTPGSTLSTALNLGALGSWRNFQDFVGTSNRNDFYRFNLLQISNVNLQLSGLSNSTVVELLADLNNNGQIDPDEILQTGYGSNWNNGKIATVLGAGTYFVKVSTEDASYNTNYTLQLSAIASTLTTPTNPGNSLRTALNLENLSSSKTYLDFVGTSDRDDFYRFNLTQTSNLNLQLSGIGEGNIVELQLIADLNGNGQIDYDETLNNDYGRNTGNAEINTALGAGTYFARVNTEYNSSNTLYTLKLSATAAPSTTPTNPGNNLSTALNLDNLSSLRMFQNFIGTVNRDDFYRFNLTQTSNLNLKLNGLRDWVSVALIADLNGNGQVDYDETLKTDSGSILNNAEINTALGAGNYFIKVYTLDTSYNTNYTLQLSATVAASTTPTDPSNSLSTALNLGNLSSPKSFQNFVGTVDRDDLYHFNLTQTSNLNLKLSGLRDESEIELFGDLNGNDEIDYGERLHSDSGSSWGNAEINTALGAGIYFVRVGTDYVWANTNYTLEMQATTNTPSHYDDFVIGTEAGETIDGLAGNDRLDGRSGSDRLIGGLGNDTLDGGIGNDIYIVDSRGDIVRESSTIATEIDTVFSSVNYNLGANVERLILTGTNTINGVGNSLHNLLTGNSANNRLIGGAGDDLLVGNFGNDTLTGGVGSDRLIFQSCQQGIDTITDFVAIDDTIVVSAAGFGGGLTSGRTLAASQFVLGAAAMDNNDRFIYSRTTGALFFDIDGTGAAAKFQIATLSNLPAIGSADLLITA